MIATPVCTQLFVPQNDAAWIIQFIIGRLKLMMLLMLEQGQYLIEINSFA